MKVGAELSPGKRGQFGESHVERFGHYPADLDHGIDRDRWSGAAEMRAEVR